MNTKLKTLLKVMVPVMLVTMSSSAHAVKWIGEVGLHFGGDELDSATFTTGDSKTIKAGGLYTIGIGPQIDITANTHIRALINYKEDSYTAVNGSASFSRFPLDVLYFYQTEEWNFGGGLTYHLNPKLSGAGLKADVNGSYDNAFGFVGEVDFRLGEFFYIGGKYTSISYKSQEPGAGSVNGSSIGVVMGFVYGD